MIGKVRYKDASGIYRNYTKKDLHYDLKHRHIEIQQNDLDHTELAAYASAYESAREIFEACAAVHNGTGPQSHREAMTSPGKDHWWDAEKAEWRELWKNKCFRWVDRPEGVKILP